MSLPNHLPVACRQCEKHVIVRVRVTQSRVELNLSGSVTGLSALFRIPSHMAANC